MTTNASYLALLNYLNALRQPIKKIPSSIPSSNLKNIHQQVQNPEQVQFQTSGLSSNLLATNKKPRTQSKIQIITSTPSLIKANDIQAKNIPSVLTRSPLISEQNSSPSLQVSAWDDLRSSLNNNQKKTELNVLNTILDFTNKPSNRNIQIWPLTREE